MFRFGETKLHSDKCVNIPIKVKVVDENGIAGVHYTEVPTYRFNGKAPFLLELNTMESWRAKIDIGQKKGIELKTKNFLTKYKRTIFVLSLKFFSNFFHFVDKIAIYT